jgi:hypothetical protein
VGQGGKLPAVAADKVGMTNEFFFFLLCIHLSVTVAAGTE